MSNSQAFVRQELVPERAAPVKTTGFVGFLRTRLFNTPTNILLTVLSALLIWFTVVPTIRFLLQRLGPTPAFVVNPLNDVLAWNRMGHALFAGHLDAADVDRPARRMAR